MGWNRQLESHLHIVIGLRCLFHLGDNNLDGSKSTPRLFPAFHTLPKQRSDFRVQQGTCLRGSKTKPKRSQNKMRNSEIAQGIESAYSSHECDGTRIFSSENQDHPRKKIHITFRPCLQHVQKVKQFFAACHGRRRWGIGDVNWHLGRLIPWQPTKCAHKK